MRAIKARPPGEVIENEFIKTGKISIQALAEGLGISIFQTLQLLDGRVRINMPLAHKLFEVTRVPVDVWFGLQALCDQEAERKLGVQHGRQVSGVLDDKTAKGMSVHELGRLHV